MLREAAEHLLGELARLDEKARAALRPLTETMGKSGWRWSTHILEAIGRTEEKLSPIAGFETWRGLPAWEDDAAPDKPGSLPVNADDGTRAVAAACRSRRRVASRAGVVHGRCVLCLHRARTRRRAAYRAGRSGHRRRQDAWLSRTPQVCGRKRTGRDSGSPPTPATCNARSCRRSRGFIPIPRSATTKRSCARAARIISAC